MSWSLYTKPDQVTVQVWHVTDSNETPEGAIAGVGQIVCKEPWGDQMTVYVMDRVPADWHHDGDLPASVAANPPTIVYEPPSNQYLYEMDVPQLRALAAEKGLVIRKGAIKRDFINAIWKHDAAAWKSVAPVEGQAPPDPDPGKVVVVPSKAAMVVEDLSDDPPDPGYE